MAKFSFYVIHIVRYGNKNHLNNSHMRQNKIFTTEEL